MENQLQSISKIFTEKLFRIPDYQRGYAWTEKQLKEYWNDIIQLENDKNHYVGVLTLEKVPTEIYDLWSDDKWIIESKSFEPYYIVDGQQRLTTTIILIQAITETLNKKDELNYSTADEIRKRYIFESKDKGISRSYIFGYEKDNPSYEFLKTKIFNENSTSGYKNEITIYTHNLEYAKHFFVNKLKNLPIKEKEAIFKKTTQNLLFNIYAITNDIDVFVAFETMNNRGKPLTNLELLKNRLIYLSTKIKADENDKIALRKIINDGWKGIYHYLGLNKENPLKDDVFLNAHRELYFGKEMFSEEDIDLERHLRRHYSIRGGLEDFLLDVKFNLKNVYEDGDNKITIDYIKNYVESLQNAVIIWYNIKNPTLSNIFSDKEKSLLDKISRVRTGRFSTLLLSIFLKKPTVATKIKVLEKIEMLGFLMNFYFLKHGIENIDFSMVAIKIHSGEKTISDLIKQLDNKINEFLKQEDLSSKIAEVFRNPGGFYYWDGIRYFLFEYELSLKEKSKAKKYKINWDEYIDEQDDYITVEHIYPQTPQKDCWTKVFNKYGIKERRALKNSLGNLVPLSKPKNSSLQNKCFIDKINNDHNYVGFRYGSYSENEISGLSEWTPTSIKERGIKLLKFMEKRWGLDFENDDNRIDILNLNFLK
ncbi:DUF262 domain-containing protein [Chryseobacterium hispalense]|uniref:DUF262 domain-containing protein n=1 Tax=Chryseobacterium hispalense TaxID=1453492 RepID=UPI00391DBEE1